MQILSRVHAKNLVRWAKDRPKVLVLSADLTSSTEIDLFKETYPDRFISLGVAEQNMLSFAGGLARDFLPSSWGMYYPTVWDWSTYFGTIGVFLALMFLFIRVLPAISIFEMREVVHHEEPAHAHGD